MRTPRKRRLLHRLGRLAILVVALAAGLYLLRGPLFGGLVRRALEDEISAVVGTRVTIGAIEGGWISDITLLDVRVPDLSDEDAVRRASAARVAVRYRLLDVLRDPLSGLDDVDVTGLDAALYFAAAPDTPAAAETGTATGKKTTDTPLADILDAIPPELPSARVRGRIELRTDRLRLATRLDVRRPRPGHVEFDFEDIALETDRRELRQERLTLGLVHNENSVQIEEPFALGDLEILSATIARTDEGARVDVAMRAGGDIDLRIERETLTATLTRVDLSKLPAAVRELLAEALGTASGPPPVLVDADVLLTWRSRLALRVRDVRATLGAASLEIDELRLGDIDELDSWTLSGLRAEAPDVAALARRLGHDIPPGVLPDAGPTSLVLDCPSASRSAAEVTALRIRTPRSRAAARGTLGLPPQDITDWRAATLALDVSADVDAAEAAALLPGDGEAPEVAGSFHVTARCDGTPAAPRISATAEAVDVTLGERRALRLHAEGSLAGDVLHVAALDASSDLGRVSATGSFGLRDVTLRDASFELDVPDLAALTSLAVVAERLPQLAGTLRAAGSLEGSLRADPSLPRDGWPDDVRIRARVDAADLVVASAPLGDVTAAIALDGPRLDVERVRVDGGLGRLEAAGTADLVTQSVAVPGFAIEVRDLAALARLVPELEGISGGFTAEGTLRRDADVDWEDARLELTLGAQEIVAFDQTLRDVTVRLSADDGRARLEELTAQTPYGAVRATGEAQRDGDGVALTLTRLDVDFDPAALEREPGAGRGNGPERSLPLRLRAPFTVAISRERVAVAGFDADVLGGRVRADLVRGADARLDAMAQDLDLALLSPAAAGRLTARITLTGDPHAPTGSLSVEIPRLSWDSEVGRVEIAVRQDADGLEVSRCEIAAGALLQMSARGYVPWVLGEAGARRVPGRRSALHVTALSASPGPWLARLGVDGVRATSASVELDADGVDLRGSLRVLDLVWEVDDVPRARLAGETVFSLTAGEDGSSVVIEGGEGGPLRASGRLHVGGPVDWRDPLGSLEALPHAALSGALELAVPDVSALVAPIDELRHVGGSLRLYVTLSGTPGDPQWSGTLAADDVSAEAVDDLPPIDRGRLRATISGRTATIDELTARLGYAPVSTTGSVTLGDDGEPVFDLAIRGENAQLVRTHYVRVRSDLDVRVSGPLSRLRVAGTARITDAWYTAPLDPARGASQAGLTGLTAGTFQLFAITTEPVASTRLDLHVTADDSIRIDNNVAFGVLSLDLRLRGTGAVPQPMGSVTCRDIAVRLPVTRLTVDSATVTFLPERPFDPVLRASAYARVSGYDLDVQVTGGASNMRVHIATSPPLTQEDSLVLLATGAPPATESGPNQVESSALAGAGSVLGTAAMDWFGGTRSPGEEHLADRVEVYVGRETSESGIATVEAEVEIAEGWYLRFERDRWEDYAGGVLWRVRFR